MTEHSPGPWRAIPVTTRPDEHAWHVVSDDEHCFAVVLGTPSYVEANARLMAEAPALVAALRGMMSRFERTGEAWMSDPAWLAGRAALDAAEAP